MKINLPSQIVETISSSPLLSPTKRDLLKVGGGLAGILAFHQAPVFAQAQAKSMIVAHMNPLPESGAIGMDFLAKAISERSKGEIAAEFKGATLLTKEIDVMNAVKAGNVAIGSPAGGSATLFPEMGAFIVSYLISSYEQAYKILNGKVGDRLDKIFQEKYGVKILYFYDFGFRHFWLNKQPIVQPKDLRGIKLRVQPSKVFADCVNGLGAVAVPMQWNEVITAAQQGVIDGADLPVVNMVTLKAYEVSKYYSMTYHNYGSTLVGMNLGIWNSLRPDQQKMITDASREAQNVVRKLTEDVDNLAAAKKMLEPHGMKVNAPDLEPFKAQARAKIWPAYQAQYGALWDEIVATK
jgi:tripartite ATP-independent transporter DctP family solute receptor